ncbi:MAG: hypothetical protein GX102_10515 [Porphyromonadaceae bacterium]|nr:hypothetical protein [Porphyromonadaceae bacterium]
MSSGSSSTRTIFQVSVSNTKDGTYTLVDDVTSETTNITSDIIGQDVAHSSTTVTGLSINQGQFVKISFCTSSSGGSLQNVNISGFDITPMTPATPMITKFEVEGIEATIDETAKTITTILPYGTDVTALTPTVTIGGTATSYSPTGAQDFTNPVVYTATDGTTNVDYTVTLTVPATPPAPTISHDATSGDVNQAIKAGVAITDIVYEITNATGATQSGLPEGLSGVWNLTGTNQGTYTISGTPELLESYPMTSDFTITATSISGYSGEEITTNGSITVKDPDTKTLAYIVGTGVSANDTKIKPELDLIYDVVTIPIGNIATDYDFSPYDLVILTESPSSGSAGMKALWGIDKPVLSLKAYAVNLNTWNQAVASNPSPAANTITVFEPNHPIFSGEIEFSGDYFNEANIIDEISLGNGIQVSNYSGDYRIAGIPGDTGSSILEFPADTESTVTGVKNAKLLHRLMIIGISDNNQQNLNIYGQRLVLKAVNYLLNAETWGTDAGTLYKDMRVSGVEANDITTSTATLTWERVPATVKYSINSTSGPFNAKQGSAAPAAINIDLDGTLTSYNLTGLSGSTTYDFVVVGYNAAGVPTKPGIVTFSTVPTGITSPFSQGVYFNGNTIQNPKNIKLSVFDISGRLVISSDKNIEMDSKQTGIYIVKSDYGVLKINVK